MAGHGCLSSCNEPYQEPQQFSQSLFFVLLRTTLLIRLLIIVSLLFYLHRQRQKNNIILLCTLHFESLSSYIPYCENSMSIIMALSLQSVYITSLINIIIRVCLLKTQGSDVTSLQHASPKGPLGMMVMFSSSGFNKGCTRFRRFMSTPICQFNR